MAVEVSPSGRALLVALGIVTVLAVWVFTSGALLTLVVLAVLVGVVLYLGWGLFVRVTRRLTGA